ncbi:MAG: ATP cone domain-containing protein [Lactovum sp.]
MSKINEKTVVKRDGRVVNWDSFRIQHAIFRAAIFGKYHNNALSANMLANKVTQAVELAISKLNFDKVEIDSIQNIVVRELTQKDKDVAAAFLAYKVERDIERVKQ